MDRRSEGRSSNEYFWNRAEAEPLGGGLSGNTPPPLGHYAQVKLNIGTPLELSSFLTAVRVSHSSCLTSYFARRAWRVPHTSAWFVLLTVGAIFLLIAFDLTGCEAFVGVYSEVFHHVLPGFGVSVLHAELLLSLNTNKISALGRNLEIRENNEFIYYFS